MEDKKEENEERIGVYLNCKTRNDDLNGFFDYSSTDIKSVNYFLDLKTTYIGESKNENKIICEKYYNLAKEKGLYLFSIFIKKDKEKNEYFPKIKVKYKLSKDKNLLQEVMNWDKCLWYVINSEKNQNNNEHNNEEINDIDNKEYTLGENDILKIGNYKYLVSKIHIKDKESPKKMEIIGFSPPLKKVKECEFCGEIMVQLCECQDYYHVNEIKDWIKQRYKHKINKKNNTQNYYFSIPQCEKKQIIGKDKKFTGCNVYFPLNFKYNSEDLIKEKNPDSKNEEISENQEKNEKEQTVNFFDFNIPQDKDYMILESIPEKDKSQNSNNILKSVHIVELTGSDIRIGRKEINDIILDDKKVSSEHAVIKYNKRNENLIIKNKSKHAGTLALIHPKEGDSLDLDKKSIFFQVNKSLIEAKVMDLDTFLKNYKDLNSDYPKVYEEENNEK